VNKSQITSRIKTLLGGEILELEVSDKTIGELIDIAYGVMKPYITDTKFITKPFAQMIDLGEEKVVGVIRVHPAESSIYTQDKMFDFEGIRLDRRSLKRSILGSYPIIDNEINFNFIDNKLYLEYDKVYTGSVTIEALWSPPLEEVTDARAETWITNYSLALTKQVVGRIRSKYKSPNVPVETDGDTMLSEAQTEIQMLEAELHDRQFGPFMILR
jgi:hypothetical protein